MLSDLLDGLLVSFKLPPLSADQATVVFAALLNPEAEKPEALFSKVRVKSADAFRLS